MRYVRGDLIDLAARGQFDVFAHGCNCFGTMGKGMALSVKQAFPEAYEVDLQGEKGDRSKLGSCSAAKVRTARGRLDVVNCYTQYHYYGADSTTDYEAIRQCLTWVRDKYRGKRIGLPKIGAGLGCGDWTVIESIISEIMEGEDVSVVLYREAHRVLVCGGRDFTDHDLLFQKLDELRPRPTMVIEGEQRGADVLARKWAEERGIPVDPHKADWNLYKRAAGPIRNAAMLKLGEPHLVMAFPGGDGTANMVGKARKAGVPVLIVS